ncbi:MAG: hypothetical protein LBU99_03045, partial [Spirochaetaceae bacterium]|nr:hypothetical protein [Spirochaetaceae bacterium]
MDDFFSSADASHGNTAAQGKSALIVLTEHESRLVEKTLRGLETISPVTLEGVSARIDDLKRLANTIAHFPSLYERQHMI